MPIATETTGAASAQRPSEFWESAVKDTYACTPRAARYDSSLFMFCTFLLLSESYPWCPLN